MITNSIYTGSFDSSAGSPTLDGLTTYHRNPMLHKLCLVLAAMMVILEATVAFGQAVQVMPAEQCFQATTGINGMIGVLGTITGGSGGTAGIFVNVPLTGGVGTAASANITVVSGAVTQVVILNPGINYAAGDVLSAASGSIGGVTGFSVPINSISINSSLAGGSVGMYIPNTLTYSQTWQDSAQTILNTNPIALDSNGCAIIWGIGTYRQILYDNLGNEVWDQLTSVAPINPYWAGTASGTANLITVIDASFGSVSGQTIQFSALFTNTGATMIDGIPVEKNSATGPVALTGGEIVAGNLYLVTYNAALGAFIIQNPSIPTSASPAMLGGAYGTLITNNSSTPNTQIDASATMAVLTNSAGFGVQVSAPSVTINAAVIGANGIDVGGLAVSTWYYVWLINNGTTTAGLVSLSSTAPTLPTGYTYSLRIGSVKTDGSANFYRFVERGNDFAWVVVTSTNTPTLFPIIPYNTATGDVGVPTWIGEVVQASSGLSPLALVPPTGKAIKVLLLSLSSGTNSAIVAPNGDYGGQVSATNPPPLQNPGATNSATAKTITLESTSIYVATQANAAIFTDGFIDSANVN